MGPDEPLRSARRARRFQDYIERPALGRLEVFEIVLSLDWTALTAF